MNHRQSYGFHGRVKAMLAMGVIVLVTGLLIALPAAAQTTLQDGADVSLNDGIPLKVREVTIDQHIGDSVPLDLPLTDSEGRKVKTGYFIDGKRPTIITLNYSDCPMLCNVQLNALTNTLRQLDFEIGKDFNVLTVSIDPNEKTSRIAETKNNYIQQLTSGQPNADEGWAFCTADQPIITKLADVLGFRYRYDRSNGQFYHPAMLAFISPQGVITRYSSTLDFPVNDLHKAIVEAGEGTVGTVIDLFIMRCFDYDPESNSYTMMGRKMMYFGGLIFVSGFLALLLPFWVGRRNTALQKATVIGDDGDIDENDDDDLPPPQSARLTKQINLFQTTK